MTSQSPTVQSMDSRPAGPDRTDSVDGHTDEESGRTLQDQPAEEEYEKEEEDPHHPAQDDEQDNPELRLQNTKSSIAEDLPLGKEVVFIAVVCLAQFMTQAALGQTVAILHIIGAQFNITNPGTLSWLIAGYSLTVSTFILLSGRFGDVFGYKLMFIIGFGWFTLWSMVAGLAVYSNQVLFIFARVFQGIGPSIMLPNGLALFGASYAPGPRKNLVFALFGACAPVGSIIGSLFAGIFALAWWPWTFWSFAIALLGITIAAFWVVPDVPHKTKPEKTFRKLAEQLDLLGGLVGVTGLVLFNFAWNQAGVVGWDKAYIIVTLILGVLIAPVFFYIEMHVAKSPLIPFQAFSSDVSFVCGAIACGWGAFGIWFYYIWQFLEVLKGGSPLHAVAWICPVAVSGACASIATGKLLGLLRPAWVMTIALSFFLIGTIILSTTPIDQVYWGQLFVSVIVMPWGMDMSFPAGTLILSNAVAKRHQGVAASLINTIVNYSISLGLGFAGTIEGNVNDGGNTPAELLKGYRGAWYFGIGISGLGVMVSLTFLAKSYMRDAKERKEKEAQ